MEIKNIVLEKRTKSTHLGMTIHKRVKMKAVKLGVKMRQLIEYFLDKGIREDNNVK